ncbi:Dyp-type peroxidase [Aestuariivirga sp.]|uniref:Dyp-type peroxidase n=1 Tax=Aestuariivirga sp. TaxID=2650926 RepID=UPI0039E7130E
MLKILPLRTRRQFLQLLAISTHFCRRIPIAQAEFVNVAEAPVENTTSLKDRIPFYGLHQAGLTTHRPANGMLASFDAVAATPADLENMFRALTDRAHFLTEGGSPVNLDSRLPPSDLGVVGPFVYPDALTVTVGVGASLFDERPWLQKLKPIHLQRMAQFSNDALRPELCHGDISIQICANTQDTTIHALRDIIKNLAGLLVLKWKQEGNVPVVSPKVSGQQESARNFLGFRDGTANPDATDDAEMDRIVWVTKNQREPSWAIGGSYQAVRLIRNFVERWDRTPLEEQQKIFGRFKMSGAPLSTPNGHEFDVPDFGSDPEGNITPLSSHIRMANPRNAASKDNLILRRPFNYSNGVTKSGQLDQGLLFIAYQADLDKGFITI